MNSVGIGGVEEVASAVGQTVDWQQELDEQIAAAGSPLVYILACRPESLFNKQLPNAMLERGYHIQPFFMVHDREGDILYLLFVKAGDPRSFIQRASGVMVPGATS